MLYRPVYITTLLLIIFCMSSCDSKKNHKAQDQVLTISEEVDSLRVVGKSNPLGSLYVSPNVRIMGDTTGEQPEISAVELKFEPFVSFNDYLVRKMKYGEKVALNFESNKSAVRFKSRITEAYKADSANFAGHYTFVFWGCGSPCASSVIIDRTTGRVYDGPGSSLGYKYNVDSRMIIANPPDSLGFYRDCHFCKPEIHILDEATKKFVQKNPNH